jgi:aerobic-type carbon monoxide dehydrogenase small subunit (CoxS/CutS family)
MGRMSQESKPEVSAVQPGHSRRNFIKGVIAAGATVSASAYLFRTNVLGQNDGMAGAVERLITLDINGQQRRVDVLKNETLAMTLRYKVGLTGTKLGCDRAECGACTVLVDDVPRYACSTLTHSVRGKKIVSIEGLAKPDGTLHPVQQAVIEGQGFQCAFCMPGFVMATVGFLKTNPTPTREQLTHGISGNICRCADYNKIVDCMMHAADLSRGA